MGFSRNIFEDASPFDEMLKKMSVKSDVVNVHG